MRESRWMTDINRSIDFEPRINSECAKCEYRTEAENSGCPPENVWIISVNSLLQPISVQIETLHVAPHQEKEGTQRNWKTEVEITRYLFLIRQSRKNFHDDGIPH